jgi:hypothetical protein
MFQVFCGLATPLEAKYIVRLLLGDLKLGYYASTSYEGGGQEPTRFQWSSSKVHVP